MWRSAGKSAMIDGARTPASMRSRTTTFLLALATIATMTVAGLALYTTVETRRAEAAFPASGRFISVAGISLRYREAGRGVAVVLLHGNPGFLEDFAPDDSAGAFASLAREFRVVAVDRPGHGYSGRPSAAGTTPLEQARLLHLALLQLGITTPVLVGHSWGGGLALVYSLEYPNEVRGMVLIGTRAYRDTGRADPVYALNRIGGVGTLLRHSVMLPIGRRLVDHRLAAAYAPGAPHPDHVARARALWLRPTQIAATVWDTKHLQDALGDASRRYGEISAPVSILLGDHDRGIDESRRLARELRRDELIVVASAGHELQFTHPELVVDAVRHVVSGDIADRFTARASAAPLSRRRDAPESSAPLFPRVP